jgi:hypothetical protein
MKLQSITDNAVCSECGGQVETIAENRVDGYTEIVDYCYGCGATSTS